MGTKSLKTTPMMEQWEACKGKVKNALLFFRLGDFYEAFHEDASLIAKELELTLTKRQDVPMCGVPAHTCDTYIDRLVAKGHRVAVAEQVGEVNAGKGPVERDVVRVVSPGTLISSTLLCETSHNYFAAICQIGKTFSVAFLDFTTADFIVGEFDSVAQILDECIRMRPAEYLVSKRFYHMHPSLFHELKQLNHSVVNIEEDWKFDPKIAQVALMDHFSVKSLAGFGLESRLTSVACAGALLHYLGDTMNIPLEHVQGIRSYTRQEYMQLDRKTQANLELTHSNQEGGRARTLLGVLDDTATPMGARLLQQWVRQPLLDTAQIRDRQQAVHACISHPEKHGNLRTLLTPIRDLERLSMKIKTQYASPKDLVFLRASLEPIPRLRRLISEIFGASDLIKRLFKALDPCPEVTRLIGEAIESEPPMRIGDGKTIREGYHPELDELRRIRENGKEWIAAYQTELRNSTGIKTLKVRFNKIFGYYIEVGKGQIDKVPASFQRKQTLINTERYLTPELKRYEEKVLTAEEKIGLIETELFQQIRKEIANWYQQIFSSASSIATIDAIQSLAHTAVKNNYTCPNVHTGYEISVRNGRHPVIEAINREETFIPNDTKLNRLDHQLILITGPNMAGKSTYIRQVALLQVMAQIGSFIPAECADIGVVDKIFTRIGASDDLARGQSTFMVEMSETANILHHVTDRSLVILDEIGRGTSTYDGIAIAWSVSEHLLTEEGKKAKTLFATHYWELTKLQDLFPNATNYTVTVHENAGSVLFLRKIVKGGTDKSYGIHVAKLAGIPLKVVERAKEILLHLEKNTNRKGVFRPKRLIKKKSPPEGVTQMMLFEGR